MCEEARKHERTKYEFMAPWRCVAILCPASSAPMACLPSQPLLHCFFAQEGEEEEKEKEGGKKEVEARQLKRRGVVTLLD